MALIIYKSIIGELKLALLILAFQTGLTTVLDISNPVGARELRSIPVRERKISIGTESARWFYPIAATFVLLALLLLLAEERKTQRQKKKS